MSRIKTKAKLRYPTNQEQRGTPVLDSNKILKPFELYNKYERKKEEPVLTEEEYNKKYGNTRS